MAVGSTDLDNKHQVNHAAAFSFMVRLLPGIARFVDSGCLIACGFITYYGLVYYSYKTADIYNAAIVFNWLVTVALFQIGGLYSLDSLLRPWKNWGAVLVAVSTSFALMLAAGFSLKVSDDISRLWVGAFYTLELASLTVTRLALSFLISFMEGHQLLTRKVAYFGDNSYIERLQRSLTASDLHFVSVTGAIGADLLRPDMSVDRAQLESKANELALLLRASPVDDVIVALPWHAANEIGTVVDRLRELPVNVYLGADSVGLEYSLRPARDTFPNGSVFELVGRPLSGWDLVLKTVEDYVIAVLLLIILSPLLFIIAFFIRIDSPGPALFRQKRHGFNNETFEIFKFRTMRVDQPVEETTVQAIPNDARVTKIGRFLRRTSLDELPQLLNVIGGKMSIVGPRPHAIDHNEEYARKIRGYFGRHRVKPGITGLAQAKGYRGLTDTLEKMEKRVKYDIVYTENWSLLLDLKIMAKTAYVCLKGQNAY